MDRETKIGFTCMFIMLACVLTFPFLLRAMGAW